MLQQCQRQCHLRMACTTGSRWSFENLNGMLMLMGEGQDIIKYYWKQRGKKRAEESKKHRTALQCKGELYIFSWVMEKLSITVQIGPNALFFLFCKEDAENYSNYMRPSRAWERLLWVPRASNAWLGRRLCLALHNARENWDAAFPRATAFGHSLGLWNSIP